MFTFDMVYIFTYSLQTYFIFRLFRTLKAKSDSVLIETIAYILYYLMNIHVYLAGDNWLCNFLINICGLFALSWIYERNWKKNVACSLVICFVLMISDVTGVLLSTATINPVLRYANIVLKSGLFLRCIVMFALVQFIKQWKALKDGEYVPWGYWVCILLVLCSSVYFIISWVGVVPDLRFVWNSALVVVMNFVIVFLYDSLINSMRKNNRNILIEEQNQCYAKELELVMEAQNSVRMLRHDLKNHIIAVRALMKRKNYEQAEEYLQQLYDAAGGRSGSDCGNIAVESMINYKAAEAARDGIRFVTDIQVPADLPVPYFDLSVMLGNLLDNAITAVRNVPDEDRHISLAMKYRQNCLNLQLVNPYMGKLNKRKDVLLSTKENREEHGLGLQSVKKIIAKYNGEMEITGKDNIFDVKIVLYIR